MWVLLLCGQDIGKILNGKILDIGCRRGVPQNSRIALYFIAGDGFSAQSSGEIQDPRSDFIGRPGNHHHCRIICGSFRLRKCRHPQRRSVAGYDHDGDITCWRKLGALWHLQRANRSWHDRVHQPISGIYPKPGWIVRSFLYTMDVHHSSYDSYSLIVPRSREQELRAFRQPQLHRFIATRTVPPSAEKSVLPLRRSMPLSGK